RITRNDGITKLPLQTEEWSNTNDTCLLIFQIHTADLNDATNTTVTYYLYFDLLSSGIKGQESYTTDLSITSAIRSDTLQNTFVRIIVLDTAVASTIIERTKSSPNLTQGGTGSNIWRNEGMYEIQEGSWWGLQHDTQWFRAHRTGPVKLTLIGTDIDFNNAVSPPRVKLTRKWKIYNNYPYFFVEDSARVANGPISTVDYDGAGDTYWKYSLYSDNLPNITYKNDTDYINVLASTSTLFNKPYWISMHSPSNYGRAVLIKSDYYTNGIFGLNVEKDVCCIGTNPNRCKFFLMNGNTGDINNYEFAFYVFGDTHNNTVIDNEWMKWNFPLTAQYTRLWRRNPIISNIQL
ncbi:MAG TPA: hypothetical protein PLJ38_12475, partial [bacterium]|nr:hypothetical protein [bacterium]